MKYSILRIARLATGVIAALALSSCLQNETTITLNKDGSGTIVEETVLGAQMMKMMTQFAQPNQPDPVAEMFSEAKAKKRTALLGEGVEYVKTEMIEKDGRKGARVHYKFADVNKITVSPGDAVDNMKEEGALPEKETQKDPIKFAYADGKLKILVPPADFNEMNLSASDEDVDPQQEAMMKPMLAEMRMTLKLVVAGGIAETNATYVDGDTITLMDVQVGKMFDHKDALKKIAETSKTDMNSAKEAFGKLDGIKVEMKDDATVTLK